MLLEFTFDYFITPTRNDDDEQDFNLVIPYLRADKVDEARKFFEEEMYVPFRFFNAIEQEKFRACIRNLQFNNWQQEFNLSDDYNFCIELQDITVDGNDNYEEILKENDIESPFYANGLDVELMMDEIFDDDHRHFSYEIS